MRFGPYVKRWSTDHLDYFPLKEGLPKMAIGLKKLPSPATSKRERIFQIDESFPHYRAAKIEGRLERQSKYYQRREDPPARLIEWMIGRLASENPVDYRWDEATRSLQVGPTGETLAFTADWALEPARTRSPFTYTDAFDAIAMNVAEDLVFMRQNPDGETESRLIHLCVPNDWAAEKAIGQNFDYIHKPIPGIDTIIRRPVQMIQGIIRQADSFERVGAVGFRTEIRLNEHPDFSARVRNRTFSAAEPSLFVRFERQTVTGFPDLGAFLFTIRTYVRNLVDDNGRPEPAEVLAKIFREDFTGQHVNHYSKTFIEANRDQLLKWSDAVTPTDPS